MQYGFRVVFYFVARGNPESAMAAAFNKASKDISKGRTAFRLFRWLDEYYKFVDALRSDYKGALYLNNAVTTFVKFVFIFMNNIYFLLTFNLVRAANVATSGGFIFMGRTLFPWDFG
jgi:hypothetical protein